MGKRIASQTKPENSLALPPSLGIMLMGPHALTCLLVLDSPFPPEGWWG